MLGLMPARAQFIPGGIFDRNQGSVLVKVLEEKTEKPVPYASAYLTARNDTLITNFTLTDTTGLARITKVTRGNYVLTIEMLGYKTYNKEHYFSFDWDRDSVNLGVVQLAEDAQLLDAAHVSAIGNPIEVRQDTIIFNASSFQVGQNQMLEDLLKRMPGMEVTKDGTVKYNGETIQKITVGGKVSTGAELQQRNNSFFDNVSLEYRLDQTANKFITLYYQNNSYDWLDGYSQKYGGGYMWRRKLQSFWDIFRFKDPTPQYTPSVPLAPRDSTKQTTITDEKK